MSGGVGAGRLDEDEDSVAAVVVNGDVALVLNGLRQSGLMGRNEMWRGRVVCTHGGVWILFCCRSSTSGHIFNNSWLSMNHLKRVIMLQLRIGRELEDICFMFFF